MIGAPTVFLDPSMRSTSSLQSSAERLTRLISRSLPAGGVAFSSVLVGIALTYSFQFAIAVILVPICILFLISYPVVAVLSYVATRPVIDSFVHTQVGPVSAGQLWGVGLLFCIIVCLADARSSAPAVRGSYSIPAVFLVVYLAMTIGRSSVGGAPLDAIKFTAWILLALAVERIASTAGGQRQALAAGLVCSSLLAIVIAKAIADNQYGANYYSASRVTNTAVQLPNGLASFAVLLMPFAMVAILAGRHRLASWVLASVLSAAVVLSFSRTAMLGLLVLLGLACFFGLRTRRTSIVIAGSVALLAVVGTAIMYQQVIANRLAHGAPRLAYWRPVLEGVVSDPVAIVVGKGPVASFDLIAPSAGERIWSHNDFVEFVATGGVVLLLAYIGLVFWMYRSAWRLWSDPRHSDRARAIGALGIMACSAFVILSFFGGIVFGPASIAMGLLLGLIRGMTRTPRETWVDEAVTRKALTAHEGIARASGMRGRLGVGLARR